jgi:hypothetical protein
VRSGNVGLDARTAVSETILASGGQAVFVRISAESPIATAGAKCGTDTCVAGFATTCMNSVSDMIRRVLGKLVYPQGVTDRGWQDKLRLRANWTGKRLTYMSHRVRV